MAHWRVGEAREKERKFRRGMVRLSPGDRPCCTTPQFRPVFRNVPSPSTRGRLVLDHAGGEGS